MPNSSRVATELKIVARNNWQLPTLAAVARFRPSLEAKQLFKLMSIIITTPPINSVPCRDYIKEIQKMSSRKKRGQGQVNSFV